MSKTLNILVLADSIDTNSTSGAKARYALITNLQSLGHQVTVLHASEKTIHIENTQCNALKEPKWSLFYVLSRVQRIINRTFKYNVGERVEKLFGQSFTFFNDSLRFRKGLNSYNPQVFDHIWTLSQGNNYRAHHAVLKSKKWHSKWFAYVHDPYPQQLYPRPYNFVPSGYKQKRRFFREMTENAYRVVFPSLLLKDWMQSYYSPIKTKSIIIPHQIDDFTTQIDLPLYFNENQFNILHAGNLLDLRDPSHLITAYLNFLEAVPEAKKDSKLIFIGKTDSFSKLLKENIAKTSNIFATFISVKYEEARQMQNKADINVILEARSEISPFLPGKFPHCVSANKPILLIGPYYSEAKRLLGETYPWQHEIDDVVGITNSITQLYKTWKLNEPILLNKVELNDYLSTTYLNSQLKSYESKAVKL